MEQLNFYTGETIDFILEGDETYNVGSGDSTPFMVFVYKDRTGRNDERYEGLKTIDSRDTERNIQYGDGFVQRAENNVAHCILPYNVTQVMDTGPYTVEVLYGNSRRSVFMRNFAFALVLGYSKNVK